MKQVNQLNLNNNHNLTVSDYISILCIMKGVTLKQLCDDLNLKYSSVTIGIKKSISLKRLRLIIDYLDGDYNVVMNLPFSNEEINK